MSPREEDNNGNASRNPLVQSIIDQLKQASLLFSYWRLAFVKPPVGTDKDQDRATAKIGALVAIFVLGFAIRGYYGDSGTLGSATISAAAAVCAALVDWMSKRASDELHDGV